MAARAGGVASTPTIKGITEYSVRTLVSAGVPVEKLANNNADWQRGQAKMRMQQSPPPAPG